MRCGRENLQRLNRGHIFRLETHCKCMHQVAVQDTYAVYLQSLLAIRYAKILGHSCLTMARSPLFLDTHGRVDETLKEGEVAKAYVNEATRKYTTSPDTPLDGSLHPSLRSQITDLVLLDSDGGVPSGAATSAPTNVDSGETAV